jgi:hypothetical protein
MHNVTCTGDILYNKWYSKTQFTLKKQYKT